MEPARELLFVVNPSSGGRAGQRLLEALRQRLPAGRVHSIFETPLAEVVRARPDGPLALVACGGDGTATALLEAAAAAGQGVSLPVGIIPLGTGNDLALSLGWPASDGTQGLDALLAALAAAPARGIDRWLLTGPGGSWAWYNYCSWGCDARVAGRFHRLRQQHGWYFRHRVANRAAYAGLGLQETGSPLPVGLALDGAAVALPSWSRSLIFANIASYAGGRRLGPRIDPVDGRCDVFTLGAGLAFGLGLSGLRRPRALGARRGATLRLRQPVYLQLDGEPRVAPAGDYAIVHGGSARVLVHPALAAMAGALAG